MKVCTLLQKQGRSLVLVISLTLLFLIGCSQSAVTSGGEEKDSSYVLNTHQNAAYSNVKTNVPFPQHVVYKGANFTKPSYAQTRLDSDVAGFFSNWKNTYIKPFSFTNGHRTPNGSGYILQADANGTIDNWGTVKPATQSEATGYAMIILALMANKDPASKEIFDGMYTVSRNFPCKDNVDLMSWAVPENGDFSLPRLASATDGDMDIAYALLLADKQWGSDGTYNYLAEAKKIIAALEVNNVFASGPNKYYPRLGIGDNDPSKNYGKFKATRSSDWIMTHTEAFYEVSGSQIWKSLQDVMITIASEKRHPVTGLIADFYGDTPAGILDTFEGISDESGGKYDNDYYYNACRFPWRMAMGYAHYDLQKPGQFAQSITSWLVGKFTTNGWFNTREITAGYELNGTKLRPGQDSWPTWTSDAFNSSFMSAMAVSGNTYQSQLTAMWDNVKEFEGNTRYYDDTLSLLNLIFVSGNWWNPMDISIIERPKPPTGLKAISTDKTAISLDWDDNSEPDIKEYNVYRKLPNEKNYTIIATVTASAYTDTGLQQDTRYDYVATAVNLADIESFYSENIIAKTKKGQGTNEWRAGVYYKLGALVTYNNKTWECKYAHTSNAAWYPGLPGLWFWEEKR